MTGPVVRRARPADFDAVAELTVAAYVDPGFVSATSGYAAELRDTAARAGEAEVLVAELNGDVVGAVTWCPTGSPWREIADDDEGEFRTLAVLPDVRGQGVGEALVAACVDRARAAGYRGVAISTMAAMTHAHALYLRLGFQRAPEADWSPRPEIDLMAFRLRF